MMLKEEPNQQQLNENFSSQNNGRTYHELPLPLPFRKIKFIVDPRTRVFILFFYVFFGSMTLLSGK